MKKASKLLIVESPAKIKTISKFLGGDFVIMSTFGHIKDLPSKKIGITFGKKGKIALEYVVIESKEKTIKDICKQAQKVDEIYLASDPDREGEIISWHIEQEIAKKIKDTTKIYRITFNEITKPAITEAIDHKSTVNMKLVSAQQARRALDRWVGYEVSPILWRKIKKGLSAGRVQSAALLLVCNREEEIVNFKTEESWSIHGTFKGNKAKIVAELVRIDNKTLKLKNKKEADATLADLKKIPTYSVKDITVKKRLKNPLPPFMTSTLQQDAFNRLGFSVERTMRIAQKLYEGLPLANKSNPEALITYMRTDSLRLSNTALTAARGFIKTAYGTKYLPKKSNFYSKKSAQDAHEAIRPINVDVTPQIAANYLAPEQAKLYSLIWKRFVACQMMPAEYSQRQVTIEGGKYLFRATGSTLIFDGFLKVYEVEEDEKAITIPKAIQKGIDLTLEKLDPKQHFTKPPPRFSEASLVKEMEKQGIGRPSTYAATLATLQKREYTTKEKKRFFPTELGKTVNKMLITNLPDIISLHFTAEMEDVLDRVAQGQMERDEVLSIFYDKFQKDLATFAGSDTKKEVLKTDLTCPKSKEPLVIRFGKTGEFIGCSGFPDCTFTANFIRNADGSIELMTPKEATSDITCPNCGKQLVQKTGRYGPFLACPGYPECKYIHQESLKMLCPDCGSKIVKRVSARGSFWGCSGYPKCTFVIFGDVEETPCPKCASPYLMVKKTKDGQITYSCPKKTCDFTK